MHTHTYNKRAKYVVRGVQSLFPLQTPRTHRFGPASSQYLLVSSTVMKSTLLIGRLDAEIPQSSYYLWRPHHQIGHLAINFY